MRNGEEPLGPFGRCVQLAVLMLLGAGAGLLSSHELVQVLYTYDHGRGETERVAVVTAVIGALCGMCVHLIVQKFNP
jgi:hypothetical protein